MHTATQHVPNATAQPFNLVLEPWANVYRVLPRQTWLVQLASPQHGQLEIVREPGGITIYAWAGCTVQMSVDGVVIETLDTPARPPPPGMSMRRYVESTFGPHPLQRP